eukprot:5120324-Prorocentrum_lima.AAC.1
MPGDLRSIQTSPGGKSKWTDRKMSPVSFAISLNVIPFKSAAEMSTLKSVQPVCALKALTALCAHFVAVP